MVKITKSTADARRRFGLIGLHQCGVAATGPTREKIKQIKTSLSLLRAEHERCSNFSH